MQCPAAPTRQRVVPANASAAAPAWADSRCLSGVEVLGAEKMSEYQQEI